MPMLKEILATHRQHNVDPDMPPEAAAALTMVGLIAIKAPGFWKVMLPNASSFTSNGGGGRPARWQTGVSLTATVEEWLAEINRFWKDVHPGEPLPFGGL